MRFQTAQPDSDAPSFSAIWFWCTFIQRSLILMHLHPAQSDTDAPSFSAVWYWCTFIQRSLCSCYSKTARFFTYSSNPTPACAWVVIHDRRRPLTARSISNWVCHSDISDDYKWGAGLVDKLSTRGNGTRKLRIMQWHIQFLAERAVSGYLWLRGGVYACNQRYPLTARSTKKWMCHCMISNFLLPFPCAYFVNQACAPTLLSEVSTNRAPSITCRYDSEVSLHLTS